MRSNLPGYSNIPKPQNGGNSDSEMMDFLEEDTNSQENSETANQAKTEKSEPDGNLQEILKNEIHVIQVTSAGRDAGNSAKITIDGNEIHL